jgi:uncharacterized protein YndB with AHSA1/START domain
MTDGDTTLTVVRSIDAPRDGVWRAWTSPDELARWWWPERFHTTYEVDLQPGGAYRFRTIDVPGMGVLAVTGQFETVQPHPRIQLGRYNPDYGWNRIRRTATAIPHNSWNTTSPEVEAISHWILRGGGGGRGYGSGPDRDRTVTTQ